MKNLLLWTAAFAALTVGGARAQDVTGIWQGTLSVGKDLRLELKIVKADTGLKGTIYSIDQGGQPLPTDAITVQGGAVSFGIPAIGGKYQGKLNADNSMMMGSFTQGDHPVELNLKKMTPETAWPIPAPPAKIPPMAADANPVFDVATIKPSKPDEQRTMITVQDGGRRLVVVNQSLSSLMAFAYAVQQKQLVGAPEWMEKDKYDITAQSDTPGKPSDQQLKSMMRKLIVERFGLKFHMDKKELSVFALSVGKAGPKLTKDEGDPNGLPGLFFHGIGKLGVRNATMSDFVQLMQSVVLDRPVLDQTGLVGRFDFELDWTPDDSQFGGRASKTPPPADGAEPLPGLFTAIQEQLGMKLDAVKAPAEVIVIDHIEKPSDN